VTVALFWVCVIAIALFQTHRWPTFAAREASFTVFLTVVIFAFTLWVARRDSKGGTVEGRRNRMIASFVILGCAAFAVWISVRANLVAHRDGYVMFSYIRSSSGHRLYRAEKPRVFWASVVGNYIVIVVGVLAASMEIAQLTRPA
jgi:hypothetical protein